MAKAADAFRTISEVADEIGIAKHVLRFWEVKFPQVRPMKRGGGRRFYRPEDLELLKGICRLLHNEGYTIRGVQKILRRDGVEAVKAFSTTPQASATHETTNVAPAESKRKPAPVVPPPVQSQARRGKPEARGRSALPATARQTISSVLEELASLRALLADTNALSEPTRLRGAA